MGDQAGRWLGLGFRRLHPHSVLKIRHCQRLASMMKCLLILSAVCGAAAGPQDLQKLLAYARRLDVYDLCRNDGPVQG